MKNLKILVITTSYPDNDGGISLAYVRTRNVYYQSKGVHVEVINFHTKTEYQIDGINVHPLSWFDKQKAKDFDLLICHAPNLRKHYVFLKKYGSLFPKVIFFFHGHEVLKINKVYSKPYSFVKKNLVKMSCQNIYDDFKLHIWRKYFQRHSKTSYCIFVSNWMKNEFYKWTKLSPSILIGHEYITYNSVGEVFERNEYNKKQEKKYDFITIRSVLDGSKYCVDIINTLAFKNPNLRFLLIGKGQFFKFIEKAPNLTLIEKSLSHKEICSYMDQAKCALMPTRTDAQGVMMCEMQAYGMPVITSDIPVCHEVFADSQGVDYIDNENLNNINLIQIYDKIKNKAKKNSRYFYSKVCEEELTIIKKIAEQ